MSSENGVNPPAPNPSTNSNFTLLLYVIDEQIATINDDSTQEEIEAYQKHYDDANKVSCIMASSMSPKLQKTFENTWAYEMNQQLKEMFQAKASKERLDVVKSLMDCKPKPRASIYDFVLEMKGYFDMLESLNMVFDTELSINIILSIHVLTVGHNATERKTSHSNWKGKATQGKPDRGSKRKVEYEIAPTSDPKEAVYFYCNTKGHWKCSCPKYLNLKDVKVKKGVHSGIYETVECISNDSNMILNVGSSNELDKSKLWHSRLGHVNKKLIAQLQKDRVLESFDFKADDACKSCLLGKMTKSPFVGTCERCEGLLELVYMDVCGTFQSATKDRKRYYVTFIDDFSRYGCVYLIKHKSNTFEVFKKYQNKVENQLGRKIKVLRSDRGGEYLSIEFFDHLKNYGIVSQLTPSKTPQLNGVVERRNRTMLNMVRSMMCRATLPISLWGYTLETTVHILNLVPTKKVSKTPFEMWNGKPRRGVLLERKMISKEDSESKIDLEEIQESTDEEPIINTDTQQEVVTPVEPDDIFLPIRRTSSRVSKPSQDPQFYYGFHIEVDKISDSTLTKLNEPANYKEAMASPEAAKWKEAMKSKIQSMYDNQVWNLIDTTPGLKTVRCKWIFKKKTDMDRKVYTYKARWMSRPLSLTKMTEDVFIAQPEGFENKNEDEPCVYVKVSGSVIVFLVSYVDDILLIGNDIPMLQSIKDWLGRCFAMKDFGDASYILGIKIYRDRTKRLIGLSQDMYLDKILKRFRMENSKKGNLPLHHGIKI
nr:hypothetical protein [Tanacetum cinerariifolium]